MCRKLVSFSGWKFREVTLRKFGELNKEITGEGNMFTGHFNRHSCLKRQVSQPQIMVVEIVNLRRYEALNHLETAVSER